MSFTKLELKPGNPNSLSARLALARIGLRSALEALENTEYLEDLPGAVGIASDRVAAVEKYLEDIHLEVRYSDDGLTEYVPQGCHAAPGSPSQASLDTGEQFSCMSCRVSISHPGLCASCMVPHETLQSIRDRHTQVAP